ncbi:MAG: glycosyltransferase [Candidatus Eremiobacteraeota bacterium]|nr:glycosyltransferase [Candidatus Eremiobacteraeota bacterium]
MSLTIGMFTDTYLPEVNGVVTSIVDTVAALRRKGQRVIVVAPAHRGVREDDPDVFRFHSTAFPFYPQFRMAFPLPAKLLTALPRMPFDVIHAHSLFFVGCLGAYLAQLRRIPLVFTYHTRWTEYTHYLPVHERITVAQAVWISREFSNRCDRVIAPTAGIAQLLRSYGVERPIDVIPTGVDLSTFSKAAPLGGVLSADARPLMLSVGRLGKEKNPDRLLDAFDLIAAAMPSARLLIVGGGPYEKSLRRRTQALAHGDRVTFVGAVKRTALGAYYRAADIFLFASTTETQGLVIIEALAHGLPIAGVDCPVLREIVPPAAGSLVEDDPQRLADAAIALASESPPERAKRSDAAVAAAAPYSLDALTQRLLELYAAAGSSRASEVI